MPLLGWKSLGINHKKMNLIPTSQNKILGNRGSENTETRGWRMHKEGSMGEYIVNILNIFLIQRNECIPWKILW